MNIAENLQLLQQTKEDIYQAINNKGVELESSAPFSAYSSAIDSIQTGGGSDTPLVKQLIQHSGATFVDIPSGTTRIGDYAFYKCMELSGVSIPDSVTSIGVEAFTLSSGLESITVPDSVTSIGQSAFRQCSGLTTITISSGVTSIGSFALSTCPSLTEIRVEATVPPTIGSNVFAGTNNCPIYVPCESVDDYKAASGWSAYASRIEGYDCQEPDPCVEDPCSSPDCPDYDAEACGGGESIPEGLHKFTISQSQWPDYAMMVEAFYNPGELKKGETGSQTVNIYEDPNGEPLNTITYNGYVVGVTPEVYVQNTNANAGVYCSNLSDWSSYTTNPLAFKLECRTAGDYYIEVADHANPNFYDANGTQINPE